ncbi:MAG: hypothetical protein ICCCNLDF_00185 [Planctomycetes bacterium]|nr:hypothetical protein [Planctomycetota bacterium]
MKPLFLSLIVLVLAAGCATGPEPRYAGPGGSGPLIYRPGVGITRTDAQLSSDEQGAFGAVQKAYEEKRWLDTVVLSLGFTQRYPEGSRVVEALILRVRARFELGRDQDPEVGLPQTIPIDRWMFLYLAPIYDERLQALLNRDAESRRFLTELRETAIDDFVKRLQPDADALYDSGQLELALADCRTLVTYYLPALELREFRQQVAELTRDVAWLMYAARAYDSVIGIADDLGVMNPAPSVKADALFISAQAQRQNGAHSVAANTFGYLFSGAGLRDTDTRWRPYALMWQINETMASSKGTGYDLLPYERALELLGEYELYAIENPNIPPSVHEEFIALLERVYGIMIERDLNSADTYSRLGESGARDYYIRRATDWEDERDKRVAALRKAP